MGKEIVLKERNNSIDIFRLFCAIMVVAIHTDLFSIFSSTISYYLKGIFLNVAVPFFFAVSGYYYLQKIERGEKGAFLKYLIKILIQYCIWSIIYFALNFVASSGWNNIGSFLLNCVKSFSSLVVSIIYGFTLG